MAKRGIGGLFVFAAIAGAVAAGVSYLLQYNAYHKELESEFHEFEDEDEEAAFKSKKEPSRNYVALSSDKDDFIVAAKDTAKAAKGMAGAAKEMLKDVGNILLENASSASSLAGDTVKSVSEKVKTEKAQGSDVGVKSNITVVKDTSPELSDTLEEVSNENSGMLHSDSSKHDNSRTKIEEEDF